MNRSERINSMLIYLNDKNAFNLKDLMAKYDISKSTALRDIQSLEALGMPLYSEPGRYGRYIILKNRLLSPILFNVDELYALYFAMRTLEAYQSTPFHLSLADLKGKFRKTISTEYIDKLSRMEAVLQLERTAHPHPSPLLKEIVEAAIEGTVCEMVYRQENAETIAHVQFLRVIARFGQWYVSGLNLEKQKMRTYRCDRILSLKPGTQYPPVDRATIEDQIAPRQQTENATEFTVEITPKGVDLFYKENYPSMRLVENQGRYCIEGYYHDREETFIAGYFLNYGEAVIRVSPPKLHESIENRIAALQRHFAVNAPHPLS